MTRTLVARVTLSLFALAGCASLPRGEYRDDLFQHRNPAYSFRVPTAWRPLTEADVDALGYLGLALKFNHEPDRLRREFIAWLKSLDAALISPRGAGIYALRTPNPDGFRLPREIEITRAEREILIDSVTKQFPADQKDFSLDSVDFNQYGPNPAVYVTFRSRRTVLRARAIMLTGRRDVVALMHLGIPEDGDADLDALAAVARSFRFE
jgi:hypothetical protein